jgi:hypothetical protein
MKFDRVSIIFQGINLLCQASRKGDRLLFWGYHTKNGQGIKRWADMPLGYPVWNRPDIEAFWARTRPRGTQYPERDGTGLTLILTPIIYKPPAAPADMAALSGVLGSRLSRGCRGDPCDVLQKYAARLEEPTRRSGW